MSQDIIINIFFAFINSGEKKKQYFFSIFLLLGGFAFPALITFSFASLDIIGINEKFCHISKYNLDDEVNIIENKEKYTQYIIFKSIIFCIRGINFIITFLYKIITFKYIKRSEKNDKKSLRLISSFFVVFISFFTLIVELVFKLLFFIIPEYENGFYIDIYMLLNSVDSVLLPFAFIIKNKLCVYLCCCCCTENRYESFCDIDNENSIYDIEIDKLLKDDNDKKETEMNSQ